MSTRAQRQHRRMIRAAGEEATICFEAAGGIDWIQAAAGTGEPPKGPPKFSMIAYSGGPMLLNGYDLPVVIDLAGLTIPEAIPILRDHELGGVVGHGTATTNGSTLKATGIISGAGAASAEIVASAINGFPWKASVGVLPSKREYVAPGQLAEVNGKSVKGPLYIARKGLLREISFVAVAADGRTSSQIAAVAAVNSKRKELSMEFTQWTQALGIVDFEALTGAAQEKYHQLYDVEIKAATKKVDDEIIASGAERKKPIVEAPRFDIDGINLVHAKGQVAIKAKSAEYAGKIDAGELATINATGMKAATEAKGKAINENWPAPRLEVELMRAQMAHELALIRAERPIGPAIHSSSRDMDLLAIEAAFCQSAGLHDIEKRFKPEVIEAADKHYRGIGLQEVLLAHARMNGYAGRESIGTGNLREVIRAAFSTHSITTMLTQTGNKFLLDGFLSIPQTWREIASSHPVNDFKAVTAYRLTAGVEYEEVGPGGEIKHGTLGQESYSMQAKTYARMVMLTRQDIINDDLGAFNDLRNRLGLGAAVKINNVFWTAWLAASSGAAFWTAARGNLVTSAALAEAGLNTAVQAFRDLTGPDGNLLNLEPDRLLIPSALEATGRKIYSSQEIRDTTASTKYPTSNIFQNRFRPIIVPQLGSASLAGSSATTWFLLTDPRVLASACMCFLNGQESPTIESCECDADTLGICLRGYHDFGVAMTEYRASVKATA